MKILYLASVRIPSEMASGLAIVRQCQAFVEIGHQVDLLVPVRNVSADTIESVYGIQPKFSVVKIKSTAIYSYGKIGFYFMLLLESLKMFLYFLKKKRKFDVIYARDQRSLLLFVLFGNRSRCYLELHTKHTDFITKFVVQRVKKVIVISKGLQEYYEGISKRADIQVEPSGVDLEQFKNLPDQSVLKNKFDLPSDKIVFGYVGKYKTMGESKGVKEIIEAFALAYQKVKNIHLLIVGVEARERSEIIEIAEGVSLPNTAYAILALDQRIFAEYLMASDVLLMNYPNTEHYAKFMSPTKLFAYLATGKIVITSDLSSVREIADESMVLFSGCGDVEVLGKVMFDVCLNVSSYKFLGQNTLSSVSRYSWKERAIRLLQ